MVAGNWLDNDGRFRQYGTQKAIPEIAGDYLIYGENREIEVLIGLGATQYGNGNPATAALPSSFQGTVASQTTTANTGIVSYTTFFPLQLTAPVTVADSTGTLKLVNPQLYIDQVDLECLVAANAGTGSATGLTGIGLVVPIAGTTPSWAQVAPNAGVQLLGACVNARMTAGAHYTFYADGTAFGTGTPPTAGSWLGNVPLETTSPLQNSAYISAIASGGTFTGSSGGGLLKLRVRYTLYGVINQ